MTSKEAVNLFKQYHWRVEDKNKALEILEKLVERDTPMIPISESIELICPKCREEQHTNTARFCSECGQRFDRSEMSSMSLYRYFKDKEGERK